jgi:hypothetical protein
MYWSPMFALSASVLRAMPSLRSTVAVFKHRLEVLEQLRQTAAQQQDEEKVAQLDDYLAATERQVRLSLDNLDRIVGSA